MADLTLRKNINRPLTIDEMDDNFQIINSQFFITDTDPTTSDDSSKNFKVGCIWTNTSTNKKYECKDATEGSANWEEASFGGDFVEITEGDNTGYATTYRKKNPDNYGDIGNNAIDLSYSNDASDSYGATGYYSFAAGYKTTASGDYSCAFGELTTASNDYSFAVGYKTTASGYYSCAFGGFTTASGNYSLAVGHDTTASGKDSFASGYNTTANGDYSLAVGYETTANGDYSLAVGYETTANDTGSCAFGGLTTAKGVGSTTIGYMTIAENDGEFAKGVSFSDKKAFSTSLSFSNKTTDDTQTKLDAYNPITTDGAVTLEYFTYRLFASQDDKSNKWIRTGSFLVDRTDSACIISNEDGTDIIKDDDDWKLDFVTNDANFDIEVTGKADTTIIWQISLEKNIIYF